MTQILNKDGQVDPANEERERDHDIKRSVPIRVLVLTRSMAIGGAERLITELALIDETPEVTYEYAYTRDGESLFTGQLERAGRKVWALGSSGSDLDLRWAWRLRTILKNGNFDILHTHAASTSAMARLVTATVKPRPVVVFTEHSPWRTSTWLTRMMNRFTLKKVRRLIAVSNDVMDSYPSSARQRMIVIFHGIDLSRTTQPCPADPVRKSRSGTGDELVVGTAVRLVPVKSVSTLLHAAASICAEGKWLKVRIAGDGPERLELTKYTSQLGIEGSVEFLGMLADVDSFLETLDVFVLTSLSEGRPVALMEAMAHGKAVVATRVGGVPEMIRDGQNGLLIEPGDVDALVMSIERLRSSQLRSNLGSRASEDARTFDVRMTRDRIQMLYHQICDTQP